MTHRALTEREASTYVGMSPSFLRLSRMKSQRKTRTPGPSFVKIGKSVRYLVEDLDAWLERHRQAPSSPVV